MVIRVVDVVHRFAERVVCQRPASYISRFIELENMIHDVLVKQVYDFNTSLRRKQLTVEDTHIRRDRAGA